MFPFKVTKAPDGGILINLMYEKVYLYSLYIYTLSCSLPLALFLPPSPCVCVCVCVCVCIVAFDGNEGLDDGMLINIMEDKVYISDTEFNIHRMCSLTCYGAQSLRHTTQHTYTYTH